MPNYVPSIGPKDAKIAIVGEAPGKEEDAQGIPFVGWSGQLVNKMLAGVGIARQSCFITNVIKQRPPNNDISTYINIKKKHVTVTDEAQMYIDLLWREILAVKPNVIIALGKVALWTLTGKIGMTQWRGSCLVTQMGDIKVIPTFHPAASAHGAFELRYVIRRDLEKAAIEAQDAKLYKDHRTYITLPSYEESLEYLTETKEADFCAYDIEVMTTYNEDATENREVSCISFAHRPDEAISIPFSHDGYNYFTPPKEREIWKAIRAVLGSDKPKLAHNAVFDSTFLFDKYGIIARNQEDTMIAVGLALQGLPSILKPKSLAFLTSWFTNMPYYKDDGKENFSAQDNRTFFEYNAKDSIVLIEAWPKLVELMKQIDVWDTYRNQVALVPILTFMTKRGMPVDLDFMRRASLSRQKELNELEAKITKLAGRPLNIGHSPSLQKYFYDELGHKPYVNRKTGKPTLDEKALKRLAAKFPVASLILEHRGISKMKGTYFDMDIDPDGRLRSSMNPIGTWTGRLSSSKTIYGTGGNMQNLPKKFKGVIKPSPDHILYEIDLSQAENRITAYIAPVPELIQAFEEGADVHSRTAARMFDMEEDEVKAFNELYEQTGDPQYCADIGQGNRPHRYWGKQANFALNYGLHWKSAALRWEISETDAKRIYEAYHSIYPGIKRYHSWIRTALNKGNQRTLTNLFGRKVRLIGDWNTAQQQGYAFIPQSTVADIINQRGLIHIYNRQDLYAEVALLNQVHDSIVFEIPTAAGWQRHSEILNNICASLETELTFRGRSFIVPADITMFPERMAGGISLHRPTPEQLEESYESNLATHA